MSLTIFDSTDLTPTTKLTPDETSWVYNGLDCCVTYEIYERLIEELSTSPANVQETYATAMRKLPPVLYMNCTGLRVDQEERRLAIEVLKKELDLLQRRFDEICTATLEYTVNWRSPLQMKRLFYEVFKLKVIRKRNSKGELAPTVNADALEKFAEHYYIAPFARHILVLREIGKKIGFLETEFDEDGRMRTSLNIAGTDTGRFSSKFSALGTGTNLQNVEEKLRRPFIPDDRRIFVNVDLEQADARNVGARIWQVFYESHGAEEAGKYLDACESGDLHTTVCRMAWRNLDWPENGDLKESRKIAEQKFVGEWSYRDAAKRLGHGTNYFGTPNTMALHTKTQAEIIKDFQRRYFAAFPLIGNIDKDLTRDDWHGWIYRELNTTTYLDNLFGRRRHFFDRAADMNTLRAAIAYDPQSTTGEFLDRGWLNLWDNMPQAQLHLPVHDSILFSLPYTSDLSGVVQEALRLLRVTIELKGGRPYSIPLDAKTGYNWSNAVYNKETGLWDNPLGLKKWTGNDEREPPKRGSAFSRMLGRPLR